MPGPGRGARDAGRQDGALRARAALAALAIGVAVSGCSWVQLGRPVREHEKLELQSVVVSAPAGPGWTVWRRFDAAERAFEVDHAGSGGAPDRWVAILEEDGPLGSLTSPESFKEPQVLRELLAQASSVARARLGDPAAAVEELSVSPPARFGPAAVALAIRAEESDAKAGLLQKRGIYLAQIVFVSPGEPHRTCAIAYGMRGTRAAQARFEESWRALLDGVELRPASEANIAAAARAGGFPKSFEPGLARRSLTLPQLGFQWEFHRERWLAPGGFTGSWGLALGVSDRVELDTPGYLRLSFGEVEALTRPELAIGAGLTGFEHDAARGSAWGFGVSAQGRKRLSGDVALRGALFAEQVHESRTGRTRPGGEATGGVVWDVRSLVTLGLETGWSSRPWSETSGRLVWVGGRNTPLVTVHALLVDVGLTGAAAWERGRPGVLAGVQLRLTL